MMMLKSNSCIQATQPDLSPLPKKDGTCFVPIVNVACIIGAPVTVQNRETVQAG